MIIYMHHDISGGNLSACGFKSSKSAAAFLSERIKFFAHSYKRNLPDGSTQEPITKEMLARINEIIASAKGKIEDNVATYQKAIDLYESCIGNTSTCHIIQEVSVVS